MTKTFNFYTKNNGNSFHNTNYSEIINDGIIADIINKNSYLFEETPKKKYTTILTGSTLKDDDDFIKAAKFLANYKKYKKFTNMPYIIGKMYMLSDGTPIVFYEDEIQIGFDTFKYSDFDDFSFLKNLTTTSKKIIIKIFALGSTKININLL